MTRDEKIRAFAQAMFEVLKRDNWGHIDPYAIDAAGMTDEEFISSLELEEGEALDETDGPPNERMGLIEAIGAGVDALFPELSSPAPHTRESVIQLFDSTPGAREAFARNHGGRGTRRTRTLEEYLDEYAGREGIYDDLVGEYLHVFHPLAG